MAEQATTGWSGSTLRVGCWLAAGVSLAVLIADTDQWPAAVPLVLFGLLHILAENSSADLPTTTVVPKSVATKAVRGEQKTFTSAQRRYAVNCTPLKETTQVEAIVGMSTGLRDGFVPEQPRSVLTTTPSTLAGWAHAHLRPLL